MPLTQPASTQPTVYQEAFVQYVDATGATQTIVFDAVLTEDWPQGTTVTEHPVEQGANVADHVRVKLITCKLKIRVTNEPLDSNQFTDPIGGAGNFSPLALQVPSPQQQQFDGVVTVPTWNNGLDQAVQIGTIAGASSDIASAAADAIANATPLGNLFGLALKPYIVVTQTGNELIAYPDPALDVPPAIAGSPIRSLGDVAGNAVFNAIDSLVPAGVEVDEVVQTTAGLPPTAPIPPITAQTIQFDPTADYAQAMIALLGLLKNQAMTFTVYGSKQTQPSMVIEDLTLHRGAPEETGTGADIEIGFKQVRIVSTQTVNAPLPTVPRAQTPVNNGAQDPVPLTDPTIQSFLHKTTTGAINFFSRGTTPTLGGLPSSAQGFTP